MTFLKKHYEKLMITMIIFAMGNSAFAQGLSKAKSSLETFKTDLMTIVPIICILAIIVAGTLYALKVIQKDWFVNITIGMILIGSASGIVGWFI